MLENSDDLVKNTEKYLLEFNTFCEAYNLLGKIKADHIGLKCSSLKIYEKQRGIFEHKSCFIYQSIISNRRISIIGLAEGLETIVGKFNYLELSDQKPDGSQKDYFDHLEIVPTTISYNELIKLLKDKGLVLKEIVKPHHTTYDVVLRSGFVVKLSREMLVEKVKREEMK